MERFVILISKMQKDAPCTISMASEAEESVIV